MERTQRSAWAFKFGLLARDWRALHTPGSESGRQMGSEDAVLGGQAIRYAATILD